MNVLVVTFNLAGLSEASYRQQAASLAPRFGQAPGLISNLWLAEPESNTYGGVYLWTDRDAAEAYADGELLAAARRNPAFTGFRSSIVDTLAAPTAVTARGLAALSAAKATA